MERKVLLVDDEQAVLKLLQRIVEDLGYQSLYASNGVEALEMLRTEKVDVVVTDLMMPDWCFWR